MSASADAGMVRLHSLSPGDEFTFAPRNGTWRVVEVEGGSLPFTTYEALDLEAQAVTGAGIATAWSNWWVWLTKKGQA